MSITARRRSWMRSARRAWRPAKPAASRSTSAPIRSTTRATRSPFSIRPATRPSPPCARAAPTSPTSWCSSSRRMTGSMPQTLEALNHARAAKVQIIVAITKIDMPSANVDKVKGPASGEGPHAGRLGRRHHRGAGFRAEGPGRRQAARKHPARGGSRRAKGHQ